MLIFSRTSTSQQPTPVVVQPPKPTVQAVPVENNTATSVNQASQNNPTQAKVPTRSMPEDFRIFLTNIGSVSRPEFNLQQFKTCSDADRYKCAKIMLELAIAQPDNAAAYADMTRAIITNNSARSQNFHKTFSEHFVAISEEVMSILFQSESELQWNEINGLGIFFGEVYLRECLKSKLIEKWFDGVYKMIPRSSVAVNTVLNILKIMCQKTRSRNTPMYAINVLKIQNLMAQGKIPNEHKEWTMQVLNSAKTNSRSSSVSSETSSNASPAPSSMQTGTIKKS